MAKLQFWVGFFLTHFSCSVYLKFSKHSEESHKSGDSLDSVLTARESRNVDAPAGCSVFGCGTKMLQSIPFVYITWAPFLNIDVICSLPPSIGAEL